MVGEFLESKKGNSLRKRTRTGRKVVKDGTNVNCAGYLQLDSVVNVIEKDNVSLFML